MKVEFDFKVGDKVIDDLTGKEVTIIGISYAHGRKGCKSRVTQLHCTGYWVDDPYLDGGRHPWEVTTITK